MIDSDKINSPMILKDQNILILLCSYLGDEDPTGFSQIGYLLKAKALAGVKVRLMVWDEKTSTDALPGLLGTHDEATRAFFKDTDVKCVMAGRGRSDGVVLNKLASTVYTHHQKTVICDADYEEDESKRQIVAFIGGLDITDGRYDSPEFHLFKTIKTLHQGDFYRLAYSIIIVVQANPGQTRVGIFCFRNPEVWEFGIPVKPKNRIFGIWYSRL